MLLCLFHKPQHFSPALVACSKKCEFIHLIIYLLNMWELNMLCECLCGCCISDQDSCFRYFLLLIDWLIDWWCTNASAYVCLFILIMSQGTVCSKHWVGCAKRKSMKIYFLCLLVTNQFVKTHKSISKCLNFYMCGSAVR